jgi:Trk-type K+ transport system membrane component
MLLIILLYIGNTMPTIKDNKKQQQIKKRYYMLSKIIIIVSIVYFIWILINIIGVYLIGMGNKWAIISMNHWILSAIILFIIAISSILFFVFHLNVIHKKIENEKNKPRYLHGKRLYTYTYPKGSKGGIFSKTYIKIDDQTVLCIRIQMIPSIIFCDEN